MSEKIIFNIYYYVFIAVLFGILLNDKMIKLKSKLLYLTLVMMITNPYSIVIMTQQHVEYLSLSMATISFLLL